MTEPLTVEESVRARWARRAVTVPLYLGLGTLSLALLPLTIFVALAVDAIRRTGHLVTLRCTLGLTLYLVCEAAGIAASVGLWFANALWPGATVDRTVVWNLRLQRVWARTLFTGATRLFGMRVEVTGDAAVRRGPLFLFCRHASTLDTLLPAVFASNPSTQSGRLRRSDPPEMGHWRFGARSALYLSMRAPPYSSRLDEIFSREAIDDPYPLYARLRRECPISRVADTGVHLVATWDLIDEALQREDDFSANLTGVLIRGPNGLPTTLELPPSPASRVIATADEPAHAVHRAVVQRRLTPLHVAALEPQIRSWTKEAVATWLDGGAGDFIPVAELIPARVVAKLLGLPDGDVSRHHTWAMMGGDILAGDLSHEQLIKLWRESTRMGEYLEGHFEKARTEPRDDAEAPLLHWLARSVEAGDIATHEALGIATVLFGAGGESTAALIGSVARRLAADPKLADRLRRDSALVPVFVEEVTRLEAPFKFHYRVVRRECELGAVSLRTGDRLMLLWASANRDASRIDDPDALRLDRPYPRDHMSFGRGAHFCVGAGLARLEAKIVCEQLLAQTACLAPCPEPEPVYAKSIFVRRLDRLPLCHASPSR